MATNTMPALSTLELMLEQIQKRDDQPKDVPPALPTRPVIKARLPRSRCRLPFNSQKNDCKGTEDQCISSSLGGSLFDSKGAKCGDFIDTLYHLESSDRNRTGGVAAPAFLVESVNGSIQGFETRNNEDGVSEKIGNFNDAKEATSQQIIGIQRPLYGSQTWFCCRELDRGVITLQSFIRGENARKFFGKKMTAIGVIQKRVKGQLRGRILEEDHAVIYLQASIRGWLAWRHFNSIDHKERQLAGDARNAKTIEKKDHVEVPYSVIVDLQRRVLKTDALLDEQKEENASLRLQIKELERKRQQYEQKMKSMEKKWQDQLTCIQASLAAATKSSSSENAVGKLGLLFALPENHEEDTHDSPLKIRSRLNSDQLLDHRKAMSDDIPSALIQNEPVQSSSSTNPEEELQKLKQKFKTWKKDFKNRLVVAKTTIKKPGNSEAGRTIHKKWWGR